MYKVDIIESSKELKAKDRINLRSNQGMLLLSDPSIETIYPDWYAILHITNDKSKDNEYDNIVICDKEGTMYYTGSSSFMQEFPEIFREMVTEEEEWGIKINQVESKQYKGKYFLRCTVV